MLFGKGLCHPCYMTVWNREHPASNSGPGWIKNHPEEFRIYKRTATLKKNGLTPTDYERMWTEQEGRCANPQCRRFIELEMPDYRHALQVDHCHKSGKVRALLCPGCNLACGCVGDEVQRLLGLATYLEAHRLN